jgi:hypothetical protein
MPHASPDKSILHPERWNGLDIMDETSLPPARERPPLLTQDEPRFGNLTLRHCLSAVLSGDFTEVAYQGTEFNPDSRAMPDGTVVAIERSSLMRTSQSMDRLARFERRGPAFGPPYAELWRSQQPVGRGEHFGSESIRFPEYGITHLRHVDWGVLLTQQNQGRVLATYGLSVPRREVPFGPIYIPPPEGDNMSRTGTPLRIGQAETLPGTGLVFLAGIDRVDAVRIVYPASGPLERSPSLRDQIADAIDGFVNTAPPPIPGWQGASQ